MLPYIAEFLGTMILIILGDGVVANVNLNKSGMKGGGTVQITIAWGLAVMLPACIFGAASGASFNPALTLALAIDGSFAWSMVPGYIVAQFAGAFVGGAVVYLPWCYWVYPIHIHQWPPSTELKYGGYETSSHLIQ